MSLPRGTPGRQAGVSLVELMVALVVGLVIMLGATQVFIEGRQSLERVEELTWRQGNLNYVINTLMREVRIANVAVAPVSSGSKVASSDHLLIEFDEATSGYDPYCDEDRLVGIEYFKPSDSDSFTMQVKCSGTAGYDLYPGGGVEVIEGVTSLAFRGDVSSGGSPYIEVAIRFTRLPDEGATSAAIAFMVANRKKAIERLN